jgi:hypothetical protein
MAEINTRHSFMGNTLEMEGISISSVNGDPQRNCPVWRPEDKEIFHVGMRMEEKVPLKDVWGYGRYFTYRPVESSSLLYKLFLIILSYNVCIHLFIYMMFIINTRLTINFSFYLFIYFVIKLYYFFTTIENNKNLILF